MKLNSVPWIQAWEGRWTVFQEGFMKCNSSPIPVTQGWDCFHKISELFEVDGYLLLVSRYSVFTKNALAICKKEPFVFKFRLPEMGNLMFEGEGVSEKNLRACALSIEGENKHIAMCVPNFLSAESAANFQMSSWLA